MNDILISGKNHRNKWKARFSQLPINLILFLLAISTVIPFLLLIMSSITDENVLVQNGYSFFPKKISFAAYQYLFATGTKMIRAYAISILVTVIGTVSSLLITPMLA